MNKNKIPYCESKNAKKYKDYFSKIIKDQRNVYTLYERSAQFFWVGGEIVYTFDKIFEKWKSFLSCFNILKCEI